LRERERAQAGDAEGEREAEAQAGDAEGEREADSPLSRVPSMGLLGSQDH